MGEQRTILTGQDQQDEEKGRYNTRVQTVCVCVCAHLHADWDDT